MRLELPNHLKSAMAALQSVSYDVKQRYPASRRNVLFEDSSMELVLDFCTAEGQPWRQIMAGQARDRKKKVPSGGRVNLSLDDLDNLLAGGEAASP